MNAILEYTDVKIAAQLERTKKLLVDEVSFSISQGESLALIGETGSGKTMIAQSIMGVLAGNVCRLDGEIRFLGEELPVGRRLREMLGLEIVYIPQNGQEFLNPSRKVKHHLYDSLKKLGVSKKSWYQTACEKLTLAGLEDADKVLEQYPFQLSGGMAQRVTIALALCSRAKLLIADEPTNGLNQEIKQQFMSLLERLFPDAAKLVITHDISVAALCDRILVLCGGKQLETGISGDVLEKPRHPYTKSLLGALVENKMQETPVLRNESGICPFYRRCPIARETCRRELLRREDQGREWWCGIQ